MLFSHHFGSLETMNRARFWLTWHGFTVHEPWRSSGATTPSPVLAVNVTFARAAAARALIESIERCSDSTQLSPATSKQWISDQAAATGPMGSIRPSGTPIHWHSRDEATSEADASVVAEYMFSRWE